MIERLLTHDPVERLGCHKDGVEDIMKDPFYTDAAFDWQSMRENKMAAPWVPEITDEKDVSNFDDIYDDDGQEADAFVPYDGDTKFDF